MVVLDVETWTGPAASAFDRHKRAVTENTGQQGLDLTTAGDILSHYADHMVSIDITIAQLQLRVNAAWDLLRADPPDLSVLPGLVADQKAVFAARYRHKAEAELAAEQLLALVASDTETPDIQGLIWPPAGWPQAGSLEGVELPGSILDTATLDPEDVSQGRIGDCYLIAALMALMQTDEGDRMLRENLRWDPSLQAYWVTLYADGEPITYLVDHGQSMGATEGGSAGIVSIYEAALNQHLTFNDLTDGGWPDDIFPLLTGQDATNYRRDVSDAQGWDFDTLRADLADGGHLVASTPQFNSDGTPPQVEVTRHTDSGDLVTTTVPVYGPHSYTVVSVESDGSVWVRNPWGEGPMLSAGLQDGGFGTFRVSAEDFNRLFHDVASSGGNE